jgi:hypothetical protein
VRVVRSSQEEAQREQGEQARIKDIHDKQRKPRILSFTADSASIKKGMTLTLSWQTNRAESVTLDDVSVNASDSLTDAPKKSKTYRLVAVNEFGQDKAQVDVTVN